MANQITYEQAMSQLTTMFPHVEKDVVAFLLESNKYHVERTVETLLSMTNKPATPVTSSSSSSSSSVSRSQQESKHDRPAKIIQTRSGALNLTIQDDFLRPPTYFKKHGAGASTSPLQHAQDGHGMSQIDQDALLAQMLQDELFMQDLAQHPERYMGAEQAPAPRQPSRPAATTSPQSGPLQNVTATSAAVAAQGNKPDYSGLGSSSHPSNASFADKWSSLTSAAKAKLANLASKFKSDQHAKQLDESDIMGKQGAPPNQPYQVLSSNLDESLLGPSHDNAPRDDDFSLDDDELPTNPIAAGSEVEMKERGPSRPRTSQ